VSSVVVLAALAAFVLFLIPGTHRNHAAIAGWACIVLNLWLELPAFLAEANFLYPCLALLAIPFLAITARRLLREDPAVLRLSVSAAVACIIYVPVALIPALQDALIGLVVTLVVALVTALGHAPSLYAWDVIAENGFYNQIILGCTGILAIAMVAGIIAGVPGASVSGKIAVAVPVSALLFLLNLARVAGVFIAVSDRWFAGFPDPTGTGDANFFWAHNVIAEGLAILLLLLLLAGLCRVLPGLTDTLRDLVRIYAGEVRGFLRIG
jgi:archaeosortase A (PGF-CTERM-specific)